MAVPCVFPFLLFSSLSVFFLPSPPRSVVEDRRRFPPASNALTALSPLTAAQGSVTGSEALVDAAQRKLLADVGVNVDVWPVGRVPAGAIEYGNGEKTSRVRLFLKVSSDLTDGRLTVSFAFISILDPSISPLLCLPAPFSTSTSFSSPRASSDPGSLSHPQSPPYLPPRLPSAPIPSRPQVFFMPMRMIRGQASLSSGKKDIVDFAWLTKEEIKDKVDEKYWSEVEGMLSDL